MCGIVGEWNPRGVDKDHFLKSVNALNHRGPDNQETLVLDEGLLNFGHTRLSILDLNTSGNQPMTSSSGRYIIIFNGEIYNFKDLQNQIVKHSPNTIFRSTSDTEIILHIFDLFGIEKGIQKLRGMFAIAVWDKREKTLSLSRDRAGEKPLYYGYINSVLYFASELKAIQKLNSNLSVSKEGLNMFIAQNNIPAPLTIYQNFFKVCPAQIIIFKKFKQISSSYYWKPIRPDIDLDSRSYQSASDYFEKLFLKSVKEQMISDVSLGAFLSGGLDSSAVVAAMTELSDKKVETHSIGYSDDHYDERPIAKKVAEHLSTNHHEYEFTPSDALDIIPKLGSIYCEPFADSSQIPTYFLCKETRNNVKVALSGDGGDELFGGYNRYILFSKFQNILNNIPLKSRLLIAKILMHFSSSKVPYKVFEMTARNILNLKFSSEKLEKISLALSQENLREMYFVLLQQWNSSEWPLKKIHCTDIKSIYSKINNHEISSYIDMRFHDFTNYLPNDILVKVDRAAMANSLETRVPFLDNRLIEFAMNLPSSHLISGNKGKLLIRDFLDGRVPDNILKLPKSGFGIPIDSWLRGPLREWAETILFENQSSYDPFNYKVLHDKWNQHISKKYNWHHHLWSILMIKSWSINNNVSLDLSAEIASRGI
jgi:asparagine synthase (glutamine-hydrolysing)